MLYSALALLFGMADFNSIVRCCLSFMLVPTSQEIFDSKIPQYIGAISEKDFIDDTYDKLQGITPVDCRSYIVQHSNEYIYYRTDHHWTSLGAFYAYQSVAITLGYSAYQLNEFNIETVSEDFRGSLYSRTLDDSITPDLIKATPRNPLQNRAKRDIIKV